ncbi:MAG: TolC family protein [Vicinamibacteria bacterium]|nr:TolC family protein [Vicinamibacteria bacterium]
MSLAERTLVFVGAACLIAGATAVASAQETGPKTLGLVDAVTLTLQRQPGIRLAEEQLRFAEGSLEATLGAFDLQWGSVLSASRERSPFLPAPTGPGSNDNRVDRLDYGFQATKLFRGGLLLTPSLDLAKSNSNLSLRPENRARVSFTLRQPLLRGKGEEGVGAPSRAATIDRDAAGLELRHAVSLSVVETVIAYWRHVGELRRLEIARDSEARFVDLQSSAEKLLAAREIAAVDIRQLSAVVASRRLSRIEAEQSVYEARVRLAVAAGLDASMIADFERPGDALPSALPEGGWTPDLPALIDLALRQRSDLQAARARQTSAGILLRASHNATRPTLDVLVGTSYQGATDRSGLSGFLDPLANNVSGPSASASLVFGWPGANRTALGRMAETQAALRQSEILQADLERRIGARVALVMNNVSRSRERVAAAREACNLYRETLAAERQRQQLGLSSLLDVINTEDRLNDSLTEEVAAEVDYAEAVATLRFETGTLVRLGASGHEVDFALLTTPPAADPPGR